MHARPIAIALLLAAALAGQARAQAPVYLADAPTKGALYRDGQTGRYLVGPTWLYRADPGDGGIGQGLWRDVAATDGWIPTTVPNAFNAGVFTGASMAGSVGWFRKDFFFPGGASATHWIVRFESVNYRAKVWFNGRPIGSHAGAYLPFELDIPNELVRAGVNRLIVRVDDRRVRTDFPPGGYYTGTPVAVGGWWNYGGILREVYLRAVNRVDIQQVQVRPLLPCPRCPATVQEQVLVRNATGSPQPVHLRGSYGGAFLDFGQMTLPANGSWTAAASATINHPRLWSPDSPALYKASLTLFGPRRQRLGGYLTYSGIRSITVTRDGRLALNGRLLNLRGVSLHEADLPLGAALDPTALTNLMGWIRALGAGVIRAHYPLNPELEEMADRYGILIWSEVPVYQVKSQYLNQPGWVARAHAVLAQNIFTNQNHPSVLLWSIGNELPTPATGSEASYIAGAATLVHQLDPTRPVGMAISDWPGVPCQPAYAPLDVIGFNDYFGWYDAGGGATADRDGLGPFLDSLRACYPQKALFVTEFGFEANRDGPVEERGTYQFQINSMQYHLGVFAEKPWLSGAIYFPLQDFAAHPGFGGGDPWPNPPFVQKGVVDLNGNLKSSFAVLAGIFHSTVQIAPPATAARTGTAKGSPARGSRRAR